MVHTISDWQFIVAVQLISEINPSDATVGVYLNPDGFQIVSAVRSACEVGQVDVQLIPALG